ncbi:MAG: 5'-methylthioadenosine/S-adenosylhomocysteine nucleosidase [Anaerolineales bacterium]|nr:5'-methylthioadenosine/S-adenosylhomocysteine nucleosidase [Anaerolineales bacterium]
MTKYNLKNIRALLMNSFTDQELRRLCYDTPIFRPIYDQLARNTGKAEIIDWLLEYAEQKRQLETLLDLVKEYNPSKFVSHQPYYEVIHAFATGERSSEESQPEVKSGMSKSINTLILPTIGIITALPKEYAAVKVLLENGRDHVVGGSGAGRRYCLGMIPAQNGGQHPVVLSLAEMGNNIAAARATLLLEHFPSVSAIIMAGIAGGIPHPKKPDNHVRLGDIVVSDHRGVIQYDFDKEETDITIHRHSPRPPSATLLEGVRLLQAGEVEGEYPWLKFIEKICSLLKITRPSVDFDILTRATPPRRKVRHPDDPKRTQGQPRVFTGPIASANKLLKNPLKRDDLRDKFGVKAIEMEGSGIADATWNHERGYLVVRGICDYCDANKGDDWQNYAAIVAAAYTRALLESIPEQLSADNLAKATLPNVSTATATNMNIKSLIEVEHDEELEKYENKNIEIKLVLQQLQEVGDLTEQNRLNVKLERLRKEREMIYQKIQELQNKTSN